MNGRGDGPEVISLLNYVIYTQIHAYYIHMHKEKEEIAQEGWAQGNKSTVCVCVCVYVCVYVSVYVYINTYI